MLFGRGIKVRRRGDGRECLTNKSTPVDGCVGATEDFRNPSDIEASVVKPRHDVSALQCAISWSGSFCGSWTMLLPGTSVFGDRQ
jgi:hypothetical protein